MELTKSEIAIADRYISKRERQLAQWPLMRWLIVVIFSVSALFGYRSLSDGNRSIQDDKTTDMEVSRAVGEAPPPGLEQRWVVGTMIKISKVLEARHQVVTAALMQLALGYAQLISGAIMVCFVVLRWNSGERDALICKLLRGKLKELEQQAAPIGRAPLQSPAAPDVRSPLKL